MTYYDYINQFPFCEYSDRRPGFEKHHVVPKAVQIERYGEVISDLCVVLTKSQHIRAHYYYCLEHPECESQRYALSFLLNREDPDLTEDELDEYCEYLDDWERQAGTMKGKHHSTEARRKISEANKGHSVSAETRRKLSAAGRGHSVSEETRRKMSETRKGKTKSTEARGKISAALKGKTKSVEHRQKMSEVRKGKPKSEEWRKKASETRKLRAEEYRVYKSQGGELKWQEWRHEKAASCD